MKEVCFDVEIEASVVTKRVLPHKTTSTEDEARLDIKAKRLWDSRFCRTFFEVKKY